jgi:hypothetical protein
MYNTISSVTNSSKNKIIFKIIIASGWFILDWVQWSSSEGLKSATVSKSLRPSALSQEKSSASGPAVRVSSHALPCVVSPLLHHI